MPGKKDPIVIEADVSVDTTRAQKAVDYLGTEFPKTFKKISKAIDKAQKSDTKAISSFYAKLFGGASKSKRVMEKLTKEEHKYGKALRETETNIRVMTSSIASMEKALESATDSRRVEALGAEIKAAKNELEKLQKIKSAKQGRLTQAQNASKEVKDKVGDVSMKGMIKEAAEAGSELAEPLKNLLARDVEGAFTSAAKLAGNAFNFAMNKAGKKAKGAGSWLEKMGSGLQVRGKEKSEIGRGIQGKAMQMAGGAAKGLGGLVKSVGPLIQMLGKLGPILGVVVGAVASLVKLFLDAEAAAKEFNKEVLASANTSQFLSRNFGNAEMAFQDLKATMREIRDQAFSLENINWGINKETHAQVLSTFQAEGVGLKNLQGQFGQVIDQQKAYVQTWGNLTQMAVAYSRNMGVSLTEVVGFQAEMMTEMGSSLASTQLAFSNMTRAADEAGIASNKFFTMIRGVSADLSLYNTRVEDAVKLLGKLGKIMSPRNAQQFMQFAMKAMKGMGRIERLKTTMLAQAGGANVGKIVQKDIASKQKGIADEIGRLSGLDPAEVQKLIASKSDEDKAKLEGIVSKLDAGQQGAIREGLIKVRIQKSMARKGTYGLSQAAGETSPVAQMTILTDAVKALSGGKNRSLMEGVGDIGLEQMAENLGVSRDQLDQMTMFEESMKEQKAILVKQGKISANADMQDVWDAMDETTKKQLMESTKQIDYAKKQTELTQTQMDKLQVLIDFLMNQFYNVIMDIYEAILSFPGMGGGKKKEDAQFMREMQKNKDPDVQKALAVAASAGEGQKQKAFAEALESSASWQKVVKALDTQGGGSTVAQDKLAAKVFDKMSADQFDTAMNMAEVSPEIKKKLQTTRMMTADEVAGKGGKNLNVIDTPEGQRVVESSLTGLSGEAKIKALQEAGMSSEDIMGMAQKGTRTLQSDPKALQGWVKAMPELAAAAQGTTEEGGAPVPPGGPAQVGGPPAPGGLAPVPPEVQAGTVAAPTAGKEGISKDQMAEQLGISQEQVAALDATHKTLANKGVVFNKSQWENRIQPLMDKGILEQLRTALYEHYLMTQFKPEDLQDAMTSGIKPSELGPKIAESFNKGEKLADIPKGLTPQKNAEGGIVTGIAGGLAQVRRLPTGEGMASVGPGERIVPKGGGGGGGQPVVVELRLSQELGQIIDARASDAQARNNAVRITR